MCAHSKMYSVGPFMLSCFVLVWKVTWLEEQQPQFPVVLPGGREDGPRFTIVMFFSKV